MIFNLLSYYLGIEYRSYYSTESLKEYQLKKFKKLFEYARSNSKFYHELYHKAGCDKLEIKTIEDVSKVPIVDKKIMVKAGSDALLTCPLTEKLYSHYTSGSTGEPFKIFQTWEEEFHAHVRVFWMMKELGYRPWHKIFMIVRYDQNKKFNVESKVSILSRFQKMTGCFQRVVVNIFETPDVMWHALEENKDAKWLWTTPPVLDILSEYMEKIGVTRSFWGGIILFGEALSESQRERFKRLFGKRIFSHYGLMECPTLGFEFDPDRREKLLIPGLAMAEMVKDEEGHGEFVMTNLDNFTMPFIRYNTHDWLKIVDSEDFPTKLIGDVAGRKNDILDLGNGRQLAHNQVYDMFRDFAECRQFKVIQYKDGRLVLRISPVNNADETKAKQEALRRWNKKFPETSIEVEITSIMPVSPSTGKFKVLEKL